MVINYTAKQAAADTYQGPMDGFRGIVTRAAKKAIDKFNSGGTPTAYQCPGCGEKFNKKTALQHAIDCGDLRSDVADSL